MYKKVPTLEDFEKAHDLRRVNRSETDQYVLFKYSQETTFGRDWDEITLHARGIIFDKETKECVVFPFKKFFNLNETDCHLSALESLSGSEFEILEKADGSMGCIFLNKEGELQVSTPGSLASDQAIWATKHLRALDSYAKINKDFKSGKIKCLVCEIIYQESRVVVEYDFSGLVLISAQINKNDQIRFADYSELCSLSNKFDLRICKEYGRGGEGLSLSDAQVILGDIENFEGFVLHWPASGHRVKIKAEEYVRLHRIVSRIHPNRIADAIQYKKDDNLSIGEIFDVIEESLTNFPEEHLPPYEAAVSKLKKICEDKYEIISAQVKSFESSKELAIHIKQNGTDFERDNFPYFLGIFNGKFAPYKFILKHWELIRKEFFPDY
jgi:RNA ligase